MSDDDIIRAVEKALARRPQSVARLTGGANNIVARVEMGKETLLAKIYFTHPRDPRDRLGAEFNMLGFLWANGTRCVPKPIAMNRDHHVGIYEFIEGEKPVAGQIVWENVRQLADLLGKMWDARNKPGAETLPEASEAYFSLRRYRDHVETRMERVEAALKNDPTAASALEFVQAQIRHGFEKVGRFVDRRADDYRLDLDTELPPNLRTLSPADHGFHNTLRNHEGKLVFLDFEYAGWDQPAQMLANACLQPEVPMQPDFRKPFVKEMLKRIQDDSRLLYRLRVLYPMLSLKWSLIMLNEFLPVSGQRRSFAGSNVEARRAAQLAKSKRQLEATLKAASDGFFLDDLIDELDSQPLPS
jgi:thiamine kinase-like enzyme